PRRTFPGRGGSSGDGQERVLLPSAAVRTSGFMRVSQYRLSTVMIHSPAAGSANTALYWLAALSVTAFRVTTWSPHTAFTVGSSLRFFAIGHSGFILNVSSMVLPAWMSLGAFSTVTCARPPAWAT